MKKAFQIEQILALFTGLVLPEREGPYTVEVDSLVGHIVDDPKYSSVSKFTNIVQQNKIKNKAGSIITETQTSSLKEMIDILSEGRPTPDVDDNAEPDQITSENQKVSIITNPNHNELESVKIASEEFLSFEEQIRQFLGKELPWLKTISFPEGLAEEEGIRSRELVIQIFRNCVEGIAKEHGGYEHEVGQMKDDKAPPVPRIGPSSKPKIAPS